MRRPIEGGGRYTIRVRVNEQASKLEPSLALELSPSYICHSCVVFRVMVIVQLIIGSFDRTHANPLYWKWEICIDLLERYHHHQC